MLLDKFVYVVVRSMNDECMLNGYTGRRQHAFIGRTTLFHKQIHTTLYHIQSGKHLKGRRGSRFRFLKITMGVNGRWSTDRAITDYCSDNICMQSTTSHSLPYEVNEEGTNCKQLLLICKIDTTKTETIYKYIVIHLTYNNQNKNKNHMVITSELHTQEEKVWRLNYIQMQTNY